LPIKLELDNLIAHIGVKVNEWEHSERLKNQVTVHTIFMRDDV
jgi:hypothetical protein